MGQIFHTCAYDIETRTCFVEDADKFHANSYSHSGIVAAVHYLLCQKPYRVMWCGDYAVYGICNNDALEDFSRVEDLLGVSTHCNYENFERNEDDLPGKSYYDKIKFIDENHKLWKYLEVWDETEEYFNWKERYSVKYSGYLVNHTKKLSVDLADYFRQSCYVSRDGKRLMSIDAVPVLTETGGGMPRLFDDGLSVDSTDNLATTWFGDLLQIVETLPEDYKIINCCFAEMWNKAEFYYYAFGLDGEGYVLKNASGQRFEATKLDYYYRRMPSRYIRVERTEDKIKFITERKKDVQVSSLC